MLPSTRNTSALVPFANGSINRLESFFNQVFGDDGVAAAPQWTWPAPIAMWQDDDHVFVEAEMPGLSETDVEVTVHNEMLYIRGERKPEEGRRYLHNSRSYGRFQQAITLPAAVNAEDVRATLTNGVLHVALPKSPEAKPKKIAISAT